MIKTINLNIDKNYLSEAQLSFIINELNKNLENNKIKEEIFISEFNKLQIEILSDCIDYNKIILCFELKLNKFFNELVVENESEIREFLSEQLQNKILSLYVNQQYKKD